MKILVCDDEYEVRLLLSMALEPEGHQVEHSFDGQDALEKIRTDPNKFDILITDNRMPRLTGLELVEKLRALKVPLKIIMITGFELHDTDMKNLDGFFKKPFNPVELLDCLNQLSDRSERSGSPVA